MRYDVDLLRNECKYVGEWRSGECATNTRGIHAAGNIVTQVRV